MWTRFVAKWQEEAVDPAVQVCLYCREPCEAGIFAAEPTWCCAWCQASAHVACYIDHHRHPPADTPSPSTPRPGGCCAWCHQERTNKCSAKVPVLDMLVSHVSGENGKAGDASPESRAAAAEDDAQRRQKASTASTSESKAAAR